MSITRQSLSLMWIYALARTLCPLTLVELMGRRVNGFYVRSFVASAAGYTCFAREQEAMRYRPRLPSQSARVSTGSVPPRLVFIGGNGDSRVVILDVGSSTAWYRVARGLHAWEHGIIHGVP